MTQEFKGRNNDQKTLQLIIEGNQFETHEQYKTGKEIKQIGGLPSDAELYMQIAEPWRDEPIGDYDKVDLARPGIEQFFIKKKLLYTINDVEFTSNKQYIKGNFLRHLGNIPPDDEIYLKVPKGWDDELIENDEFVNLARPGKEHFESRKFEVCLIVNLKEKNWVAKKITYEEVVKLAYPSYDSERKNYTVKFTEGPKQNPQGSMSPGDIVNVKNKMTFHVTETNKS